MKLRWHGSIRQPIDLVQLQLPYCLPENVADIILIQVRAGIPFRVGFRPENVPLRLGYRILVVADVLHCLLEKLLRNRQAVGSAAFLVVYLQLLRLEVQVPDIELDGFPYPEPQNSLESEKQGHSWVFYGIQETDKLLFREALVHRPVFRYPPAQETPFPGIREDFHCPDEPLLGEVSSQEFQGFLGFGPHLLGFAS